MGLLVAVAVPIVGAFYAADAMTENALGDIGANADTRQEASSSSP